VTPQKKVKFNISIKNELLFSVSGNTAAAAAAAAAIIACYSFHTPKLPMFWKRRV
jgi:hypothetical protein